MGGTRVLRDPPRARPLLQNGEYTSRDQPKRSFEEVPGFSRSLNMGCGGVKNLSGDTWIFHQPILGTPKPLGRGG